MKKLIPVCILAGLALISCMKSKTCTCTDPSGKVLSKQTQKSLTKKDLKQFEEDCTKKKVVTIAGSNSYTTPCVISD